MSTGFDPMDTEVRELPVKGELPQELDGTLLRIGPDHADGQPLIAALRIRQGHAEWFRTRRIRTDPVCRITGDLPSPGPRRCPSDNTDAALIQHAGRTLALGDGVLPYELAPDLTTKARYDFDGTLPAGFTARPVHDPVTGELFAAVLDGEPPRLWYLVVDVRGRIRKREPVTSWQGHHLPALALTQRHVLCPEPTRIGVMPREGTERDLVWITVGEGGIDRVVNAFDRPDKRITLDVVRRCRTGPVLWRWTLDPGAATASGRLLVRDACTSPVIDPRYHGSEHRYCVMLKADNSPVRDDVLVRFDLATGSRQTSPTRLGRLLTAPVTVPRSPTAPEGTGWLLAFAQDTIDDSNTMVVLDTSDFGAEAVALVDLPSVPHRALHAAWTVTSAW
ncbi:carotenoid oxygenase family protein [Streptomyces sp. NPDC001796]|uniref:carotenoid oxygenase family protein n=1 Tax=Streptomyces sp. NPDC001796 TaxID=3364609 RepID=UPI0036A69E3A